MRKELDNLAKLLETAPKFQGTSTDGQVQLTIKKNGEKTLEVKPKENESAGQA